MKPLDLIWLLLPEETLPLLVVGLALLSLFGLVRPARATAIVVLLLLLPVISLLVEEILARLPWYVGVLLLVALLTNVIRLVLELFLGREAAGVVLGQAAIRGFKLGFFLVTLPVRGLVGLGRLLVARRTAKAPTT